MKRFITFLSAILIIATVFAQSPEKMSYQAIVRDAGNVLVSNHSVGMQISILHGSATGKAVYTETQAPTTNTNGLVSIDIGTGTVVVGDFSTIDWAIDIYFIKTEIDPTGGTNYTITGTSQLLSVPYALHAKTVGVVDYNNLVNLPTYSVGDFAQGGIVFWVDETGQHGLVCAKLDLSSWVRWFAGTYGVTGATGDGPFSGEANTLIIISSHAAIGNNGNDYAARSCNELQITEGEKSYGDWYLPSLVELELMYQNKATIDATAIANSGTALDNNSYWSSFESGTNLAWSLNFINGSVKTTDREVFYPVRSIRAF